MDGIAPRIRRSPAQKPHGCVSSVRGNAVLHSMGERVAQQTCRSISDEIARRICATRAAVAIRHQRSQRPQRSKEARPKTQDAGRRTGCILQARR